MITAAFVTSVSEHFTGDARLYRLSEAIPYNFWDEDDQATAPTTEYVVISATVAFGSGPETYIFASDQKGNILDWSELSGSFRGACDHNQAISNAGWELEAEDD